MAVPAQGADLADYTPVPYLSGTLTSAGSDTMANLMALWAEAFRRLYPSVKVQVRAPGSSSAPPALTEATATLGPMSRLMKAEEVQSFVSRYGYPPTAIPVAMDALAVYVHQDNPLQELTLAQLAGVFAANHRCADAPAPLQNWGQLGLSGPWRQRPLQRFGRNAVSGTYGVFKAQALCGGDFSARVNEQPGSASVVQAVSATIAGIGYSGIGYRTASVRAVPLAAAAGEAAFAPTAANVRSGRYPLTRMLYVYVNKPPGEALQPLERELIRLVYSREGQAMVLKTGYLPLDASRIAAATATLGLWPLS